MAYKSQIFVLLFEQQFLTFEFQLLLLLRSCVALRIAKHSENTQHVVEYLKKRPEVTRVIHPSVQTGVHRQRTEKYLKGGLGRNIPCMPSILLVRKLSRNEVSVRGASPCIDLIGLEEYLGALGGLDIAVHEDAADA